MWIPNRRRKNALKAKDGLSGAGNVTYQEARIPGEVTELLRAVANGSPGADTKLMTLIEAELRRIASQHMRKERKDHTLQTTALVNEAYLRLVGPKASEWTDRNHFLAVASQVMRRILIDYARAHKAEKRGGQKIDIDTVDVAHGPVQPHILDVNAALEDLALIAPRQAQLVELRFFGGLSLDEAAAVLHLSERTIDKDWSLARAWLRRRLGHRQENPTGLK
jgi:RNA polymerase sigma factor (TIGR02999 family)